MPENFDKSSGEGAAFDIAGQRSLAESLSESPLDALANLNYGCRESAILSGVVLPSLFGNTGPVLCSGM